MKKKKESAPQFLITPNINRVIVRRLSLGDDVESAILIPGQLKAGESLYAGVVIHPGDTNYTKDQIVYYSEYSAAGLINIGSAIRGEQSWIEASNSQYFIVAVDDIMASEDVSTKLKEKHEDKIVYKPEKFVNSKKMKDAGIILK